MDLFSGIGRGLEDLGKKAKDVGQKVNLGAKEASKNTKIKLQLKELETRIQTSFQDLGRTYYMEMRSQSHKTELSSAELLVQLDELHREREALENLLKYREINGMEGDDEKRCTNCHELLSEGDKYCSYCGQEVLSEREIIEANTTNKIECPNCHFKAKSGSDFCSRCGTKL